MPASFRRVVLAMLAAALSLMGTAHARELTSQVTYLDQMPRVHPEYPVPHEPNMLFYIERSSNSNTVIYAANFDAGGKLDKDKPVIAYWRWYNVDGHRKPLNFAERMFAYGVTSVRHDGPDGMTSFKLAALPERTLYLRVDKPGHAEVLGRVGDHWGRLVYVYLYVDDSGLLPDVTAMDFFGVDLTTDKPFREHVIPH